MKTTLGNIWYRKVFFLCVIVGVLSFLRGNAEPTDPNLIRKIKLSDGKNVSLRMIGDEFGHFWEDCEDGKKYQQVKKNVWKQIGESDVSKIMNKARKARTESFRALSKRKKNTGLTGIKKVPVILVEFTDVKFENGHNSFLFDKILNEPGYNEGSFVGSARDYFFEQSNGLLELQFDVVGPVTMPNTMAYYAGDDGFGHCDEMAKEACRLVDDYVDFSQYDWRGDGMVDQICMIYAGCSQSTSGNKEDIWAHKGMIWPNPVFQDGKFIQDYACSPELHSAQNRSEVTGIGTFCHEFSHCLGLPDMYDQTTGNYGTDRWDLMGTGGHNGNGYVPAGYTAFDKLYVGWQEPIILNEHSEVTSMRPMSEGGDFYLIPNDNCKDEFYLLENRQQTGWDIKLPGHGMLISHIDYDELLFSKNVVNRTGIEGNDHERCGLVLADNDKTVNYNDYYEFIEDYQGDLWPYKSNNSLTNTSVPAATLFHENIDGTYLLNKPVTSIRENSDGTMAFIFDNDFIGENESYSFNYKNDTLRFNSPSSIKYKLTIANNSYSDYSRPIAARVYKFIDGEAVEIGHDVVTMNLKQGEEKDYIFNVNGLSGNGPLYIAVEYYNNETAQVRKKLSEKEFYLEDINKFIVSVEDHNLVITSKSTIQLDVIAHNESYYDFTTGLGTFVFKDGEPKAVASMVLNDPIPSYGSRRMQFNIDGLEENIIYRAYVYAAKMNEAADGYWSLIDGAYRFVINDDTITFIDDIVEENECLSGETICLYSIDGRQLEVIDDFSLNKIQNKGIYIIKSLKSGKARKVVVK